MTNRESDSDARSWAFEEGDIIREEHEPHAPGGVAIGKSEYRVERLLYQEGDEERFYYVETESGGNHLYAASAIEHSYEVIGVEESRAWTVETTVERTENDN